MLMVTFRIFTWLLSFTQAFFPLRYSHLLISLLGASFCGLFYGLFRFALLCMIMTTTIGFIDLSVSFLNSEAKCFISPSLGLGYFRKLKSAAVGSPLCSVEKKEPRWMSWTHLVFSWMPGGLPSWAARCPVVLLRQQRQPVLGAKKLWHWLLDETLNDSHNRKDKTFSSFFNGVEVWQICFIDWNALKCHFHVTALSKTVCPILSPNEPHLTGCHRLRSSLPPEAGDLNALSKAASNAQQGLQQGITDFTGKAKDEGGKAENDGKHPFFLKDCLFWSVYVYSEILLYRRCFFFQVLGLRGVAFGCRWYDFIEDFGWLYLWLSLCFSLGFAHLRNFGVLLSKLDMRGLRGKHPRRFQKMPSRKRGGQGCFHLVFLGFYCWIFHTFDAEHSASLKVDDVLWWCIAGLLSDEQEGPVWDILTDHSKTFVVGFTLAFLRPGLCLSVRHFRSQVNLEASQISIFIFLRPMVVLAPQKFALLFTLGQVDFAHTSFFYAFPKSSHLAPGVSSSRITLLPWQLFSSSRAFSFPEATAAAFSCIFCFAIGGVASSSWFGFVEAPPFTQPFDIYADLCHVDGEGPIEPPLFQVSKMFHGFHVNEVGTLWASLIYRQEDPNVPHITIVSKKYRADLFNINFKWQVLLAGHCLLGCTGPALLCSSMKTCSWVYFSGMQWLQTMSFLWSRKVSALAPGSQFQNILGYG